jgi:hypothetical protein
VKACLCNKRAKSALGERKLDGEVAGGADFLSDPGATSIRFRLCLVDYSFSLHSIRHGVQVKHSSKPQTLSGDS